MVDKKKASNSKQTKEGKVTAREEAVGAIILFVIILVALFIFIFQEVEEPVPDTRITPDEQVDDVQQRYDDLSAAIQSGDVTNCEFFNTADRTICIQSIQGMYETEDELGSQEVIDQAVQAGDPSLCDSIEDPVERIYCESKSGSTLSDQESTVEDSETDLIIQQAYETGDASLCNQITNPPKRQLCLSKCE